MDVEVIRTLRRAEPFKPFHLVLRDGRKLPVDLPNTLAIAPDGKLLVFQTLDSWFEPLSPGAVVDVDFDVNTLAVSRERQLATAQGQA